MAFATMKAQAGTRKIGSFVEVYDYGRFRKTSHYRSFEEFTRAVANAAQNADIVEPMFDGKPCAEAVFSRIAA